MDETITHVHWTHWSARSINIPDSSFDQQLPARRFQVNFFLFFFAETFIMSQRQSNNALIAVFLKIASHLRMLPII